VGRSDLPPLSKEEVLAIAGHVNEFWRMLAPEYRGLPHFRAVADKAQALTERFGQDGQVSLHLGQILGSTDPEVASAVRAVTVHSTKRIGPELSVPLCW